MTNAAAGANVTITLRITLFSVFPTLVISASPRRGFQVKCAIESWHRMCENEKTSSLLDAEQFFLRYLDPVAFAESRVATAPHFPYNAIKLSIQKLHLFAVDVPDLERDHLADPQPGPIGYGQGSLMFDV